jgi:hypothetical protein
MASAVRIDPELQPIPAADPAAFVRQAFEGVELGPLIQVRLASLRPGAAGAANLLELGTLFQLTGEKARALECQRLALSAGRLFRHGQAGPGGLRLLMLVTAGDLMTNTPLELMLEGRGVEVTRLFLDAHAPLPDAVPDHDLAVMAVSESDETRPLLEQLIGVEGRWRRPMLNRADQVLELARDRLYRRLQDAPGVVIPPTFRLTRAELLASAPELPMILRPVGSHAGKALERIDTHEALEAYLAAEPAERLYASPFVDYAGADGLFRKYRIAVFDGAPFLCHMAVSGHWMVHYLNAGMTEDGAKRAEEQAAMEGFDQGFARRHAAAFAALSERLGLGYFAIDCAETPDGRLLIFEADVAMIVHDLDPVELYPYKKVQMKKVFDAFETLLRDTAHGAAKARSLSAG